MSNIVKAFSNGYNRMVEKSWDYIYVVVDVHGTIFKPSYHNKETFEFYPDALETLQALSDLNFVKLIMWTSSTPQAIDKYLEVCEKNEIYFDFVNTNTDIAALSTDPKTTSFYEKFYFNVGIDDKFGFEPNEDWTDLLLYLTKNFH